MPFTLEDLDQFNDDVKISIDGRELTLGQLRAHGGAKVKAQAQAEAEAFVNRRIAELTPREQAIAERQQALDALARKLGTDGSRRSQPAPLGYTAEQWEAMQADPYMRPILQTMNVLAEKYETLERQSAEERARQEQYYYATTLRELANQDKEYADPVRQRELMEYAAGRLKARDLRDAYRLKHYDRDLGAAEERGYKRGKEEADKRPPVPPVPHGFRRVPGAEPPPKLPGTFDEWHDQAVSNAELLQEIHEAGSAPSG